MNASKKSLYLSVMTDTRKTNIACCPESRDKRFFEFTDLSDAKRIRDFPNYYNPITYVFWVLSIEVPVAMFQFISVM